MNKSDFSLLASMVAGKVGVTCIPSEDYDWKANPKTKTIWYPNSIYFSDADVGYLTHECAHLRFSGISHNADNQMQKWMKKTGKSGEQTWSLVNALEDIRIERKIVDDVYPGAKRYLEASYWNSFNKIYDVVDSYKYNYYGSIHEPNKFKEIQNKLWLH